MSDRGVRGRRIVVVALLAALAVAVAWVCFAYYSKYTRSTEYCLRQLRSDNEKVRYRAFDYLYLHIREPGVGEALAGALKDPSPEVRRMAILSLSELGSTGDVARYAVPISECLLDSAADVRERAYSILLDLGPRSRPCLPNLLEAIERSDGLDGWRAVEILAKTGAEDNAILPTLVGVVRGRHRWSSTRHNSVMLLGKYGAHDESVVKLLLSILKDPTDQACDEAILALMEIIAKNPAMDPVIDKGMSELPNNKFVGDLRLIIPAQRIMREKK